MRKIFFQNNIVFFFLVLVYLVFVTAGSYVLYCGINTPNLWWEIPVGLITIILFIIFGVSCLYYHIVFYDEKIYISGELFGSDKTQYKDEIFYEDIVDVKMILTNKNSKRRRTKGYGALTPRVFFEFLLKNGKTKLMYIYYFSHGARRKMIETINEKTGLNLSYDAMELIDLSIYRKKD